METRERKQKTCFLKTLEIHLAEKTTKKRQNSDTSTAPACPQHPPDTLNGETRRAPVLLEPAPNLLGRSPGANKWHVVLPGTNQQTNLDRLPRPEKKEKTE
jgi:hypothetical protein